MEHPTNTTALGASAVSRSLRATLRSSVASASEPASSVMPRQSLSPKNAKARPCQIQGKICFSEICMERYGKLLQCRLCYYLFHPFGCWRNMVPCIRLIRRFHAYSSALKPRFKFTARQGQLQPRIHSSSTSVLSAF